MMNLSLSSILSRASALLLLAAVSFTNPVFPHPVGRAEAEEYCLTHSLGTIEGIWEYPGDGVTVLIYRDKKAPQSAPYDLIVVDSDASLLSPGEKLGEAIPTPDPKQFQLNIFSSKKKGILTDPRKCAAKLIDSDNALEISTRKVKFSFHALSFIPRFWRVVSVKVDDPAAALPVGMIKVFPSYDGNGSSRQKPRIL